MACETHLAECSSAVTAADVNFGLLVGMQLGFLSLGGSLAFISFTKGVYRIFRVGYALLGVGSPSTKCVEHKREFSFGIQFLPPDFLLTVLIHTRLATGSLLPVGKGISLNGGGKYNTLFQNLCHELDRHYSSTV